MPNIFPCLLYQQDSGIAHRKKDHMSVHIQHTHRETLCFCRLPSQLCLAHMFFSWKIENVGGIQHTKQKVHFPLERNEEDD